MNRKGKAWRLRFLLNARVVFVVASAGSFAVLLLAILTHREPTYRGRTVTGWLRQSERFDYRHDKEISEAFRGLGSKAVPIEIKALSRKDSQLDKWYRDTYPKLPGWLQRVLLEPLHPGRLRVAAWLALLSNEHTDEHLSEIVPLLSHDDPSIRYHAASLIERHFRPENMLVLPSIVAALRSPDPAVRCLIARSLGKATSGDAAVFTAPSLLRALTDNSTLVRIDAARSLTIIDTNTITTAVPVLREALTNSDLQARVHAATTLLGSFDPGSVEAIRVLVSALTRQDTALKSPNPRIKAEAEMTLRSAESWVCGSARRNTNVITILTEMDSGDSDPQIQVVSRKLLDRISSERARQQEGLQSLRTQ